MRAFLLASALVPFLTTATPASERSHLMPAFQTAPSEDYLRKLDNEQLRIVRRAAKTCGHRLMRAERDPCVTTTSDRVVNESGDTDLQTFHNALPVSERYDENRNSFVWRSWLRNP